MVDIATATISGAIAGSLITILAQWFREKESEKKQTKSVYILIKLEIEQNIELLGKYWEKVTKAIDANIEDGNAKNDFATQIIRQPLPSWKKNRWCNQDFIALALTETEIKKTQKFYDNLDFLKSIYLHLLQLEHNDNEYHNNLPHQELYAGLMVQAAPLGGLPEEFNSQSPYFWDEFEKTVQSILENNNPLKE